MGAVSTRCCESCLLCCQPKLDSRSSGIVDSTHLIGSLIYMISLSPSLFLLPSLYLFLSLYLSFSIS